MSVYFVCCVFDSVQNLFLTAQSTQIKSVISVPIKDFIHHYPRALFNDIPRVWGVLLRHTRVGFDSVWELFGETIRNVFGCSCYFVVECYGCVWWCSVR